MNWSRATVHGRLFSSTFFRSLRLVNVLWYFVCYFWSVLWGSGASQKLRFTKAQLRHLEDTFERLQRPNAHQKATLAMELGVQPRQVEVWFQNRRARGKAKRTETDCEVLRQRCQDLIVENHQLNYLIQVTSSATNLLTNQRPHIKWDIAKRSNPTSRRNRHSYPGSRCVSQVCGSDKLFFWSAVRENGLRQSPPHGERQIPFATAARSVQLL